MKYQLTLEFNLMVESGNKDIKKLKKTIESMYSENLIDEKTIITKYVKKHNGLFKMFYP